MKKVLIYINPEKTIQIQMIQETEKDMFGYKLPKQTIETTIEGEVVRLNLIDVRQINS